MKFLAISDLHGNVSVLDKLDSVFKSVDAVLFAGDFCECFKTETGKPALDALIKKHDEIYAVLGNCDEPDFIEELEDAEINAERILNFTEGLSIIGSGGGQIFTKQTPNERTEEDLIDDFKILNFENASSLENLIVISHNPPKDTVCDAVNKDVHAGSLLFRKFIEEKKPLFVVCGHIHEGVGIDKIGETIVVNPGPLTDGKYAIIEVLKEDKKFKVSSAELFSL